MLSRSAHNIYWMHRYLERGSHVCRLLAGQFEALEDSTVDEIDRNWRRVFDSMGREPIAGGLASNLEDDDLMLTDSFTLADEMTFELNNPDSVRSCIAFARENARQARNVVGKDFWLCVNGAHLDLANTGITSIWNDQPRGFYRGTLDLFRTLSGISESTFYRDHSWHFLELGRFVERLMLVATLLDSHVALFPTDRPNADSDWRALLEICEARVAFHKTHSLVCDPERVVEFLVADPMLSHSIRYSLNQVSEHLDTVCGTRREPFVLETKLRVYDMINQIDFEWTSRDKGDAAVHAALQKMIESCRTLHTQIESAFFNYDIDKTLNA